VVTSRQSPSRHMRSPQAPPARPACRHTGSHLPSLEQAPSARLFCTGHPHSSIPSRRLEISEPASAIAPRSYAPQLAEPTSFLCARQALRRACRHLIPSHAKPSLPGGGCPRTVAGPSRSRAAARSPVGISHRPGPLLGAEPTLRIRTVERRPSSTYRERRAERTMCTSPTVPKTAVRARRQRRSPSRARRTRG
jgi:hypothetical protein